MFNQYPYLNITDLNLDFILNAIREMKNEVTNFVSINAIKYADPIQWNITSQYEKNTIVIDPVTGTAYISVAPVPSGVSLTRSEYWTVVFDLGSFVTRAAQNFTSHWESETTTTATFATTTGGWLVWGDVLYRALTNITAGDTYVVGGNIEHFTVEDLYNAYLDTIANILALVGDLADLNTSDKTSIVNAINEVLSNVVNLDTAINTRVDNEIAARKSKPFVNVKDYGAVGDGVTNDTQAIAAAITAGGIGAPLYFPLGTYLVDNAFATNSPLYVAKGTKIVDSNGVSLVMKPTTNYFNNIEESITKHTGAPVTPQGGAAILYAREQINDNTRNAFTINGTINPNENRIYTSDSLDNVKLGDGIICANIPDFADTTRYACMRVIAIGIGYIEFAPDKGDASGYGESGYTYTGGAYNDTFTIRPRIWLCPEFLGVRTGNETNPDAVYWCGNDVAESFGQKIIAREIDMLMWNSSTEIMQGLLVTGIKNAAVTSVAVDVQLAGTYNGTVAFSARNHDTGLYTNAWTAIRMSDTYNDRTNGGQTIPIAGGIVQESYGTYLTKHPSLALKQVVDDANNVVVSMKRINDNTPQGRFMECLSEDGNTDLAFINASGQLEAQQLASKGDIIALGNVTGARFAGPLVRAVTVNATQMIKYEQTPVVETITPNKTITFEDANGNTYKIPIYQA